MTARADAYPATPPVPRLALVLTAGAGLHLAIIVVSRSALSPFLDLGFSAVIAYLTAAMPLVIAASIVAGWDRWPAVRGWFVAAAVAYGSVAVVDAVGWAFTVLSWPQDAADPNPATAIVRSALLVAASLGAPLLAAVGLWRSAPGALRPTLVLLAGVPALAVLAIQLLAVLPVLDASVGDPLLVALSVGYAMLPGALAALGVAAARAIPRRYVLPEVLIAIGAMAFAAASAALTATTSLVMRATFQGAWIGPVVTVSAAIGLAGLATIALGFFTARLSAPGER